MKTTLEVQPDGRIFVIDGIPEEPHCLINFITNLDYPRQHREYKEALASAPRILCADQEQAVRLISQGVDILAPLEPQGFKLAYAAYHDGEFIHNRKGIRVIQKDDSKWIELDPGIYQVDCEWEKEERHCEDSGTDELGRKVDFEWVAILKESPKEESQEAFIRFFYNLASGPYETFWREMTNYTITRNS